MSFSIAPEKIQIFGFTISETVVIAFGVSFVLILVAIILRLTVIRKMSDQPKGIQNVLECIVEYLRKFSINTAGHVGDSLSCFVLVVGLYSVGCGLAELIGFRSPLSDLSNTAVLAVMSFILINVYGIRAHGIKGRIKSIGGGVNAVIPIKMVTDLFIPVSLACRMFGNLLGGFIIMHLVYSVLVSLVRNYFYTVLPVALAAVLPGILSIYFGVFHVLIQAYIFLMLTLTFVREASE